MRSFLYILPFFPVCLFSQIPRPRHVIEVIFENKSYSQIMASAEASYFKSFLQDTNAAVFTQFYALTHPSQPNYMMLFSGSDQGVKNNDQPANAPFSACNLASSLIERGFSFAGYCEDLPYEGYLGAQSGSYYRKHNPWASWQGTRPGNLPASVNKPYSAFPSNFSNLPDVSFVVPDIVNCMHDGSIGQGDTWLRNEFDAYRKWCLANNSLLVITFDEDNGSERNRIMTIFYGPMVKGGSYSRGVNHYSLLRTYEDMFGLQHCGVSQASAPIDYVWKGATITAPEDKLDGAELEIFPVPAHDRISVLVVTQHSVTDAQITLTDAWGKKILEKQISLPDGENLLQFNLDQIAGGIHLLRLRGTGVEVVKRIAVMNN